MNSITIGITQFNRILLLKSSWLTKSAKQMRQFGISTPLQGHRWYPDTHFIKDFSGSVMWPTPETERCYKTVYHGRMPPVERKLQNMWLNWGPQHPAAHGVLRLILELDGELVKRADAHVGFLHRATEKLMEYKHYNQSLPFMDRLDYVSTLANEQTFALAVENLLNIKVPPRAQAIRVLCAEMSRIANHILNVIGVVLDAGGITPFFWLCEEREKMYELFERLCGARVHNAYIRVGGVIMDLPIGYLDDIHEFLNKLGERYDEFEDLVTGNRLYYARTADIGVVSAHDAISLGFTGPMLRSTGVKWDLRIAFPYDGYDQYDFDCVVGIFGDSYERHLLRCEEMRQSIRIIEQVMNTIPEGEIMTDDSKVCLPPRAEMKLSMESLIHHFKLCTEGYRVPPGITYTATEAPKGEMGIYMVSDGTTRPYRVHLRAAALPHLFGIPYMVAGQQLMLADITIIVASIDITFGDADR